MSGHRAVVAALLLVAALQAAGDDREPIGYVEAIRGTVWMKAGLTAPPIRLFAPRDLARRVYAGELIRCDKDSWIRLRLGYESQELHATSTWFQFSTRWPRPIPRQVQDALAEYGRAGGRPKGSAPSSLSVYSPAENSAVLAETFSIRWNPGPVDCPLTVAIHDMNRRQLWSRDDIDATAKAVEDPRVRRALLDRARDQSTRLELTISGDCMSEQLVAFKVLSPAEADALKEELSDWDYATDDPLLLHLGRAFVFAHYRLYGDVAAEYEEALALAPQSRDLLSRTIAAHERTGNVVRANELAEKLGEE